MMRALVTGDKGFVGRHMVQELKGRGWEVYGIDILDRNDAVDYFTDPHYTERLDLVVHCAYNVGGRSRIDSPTMDLAKNLMLDASLFDWALRANQGAILYFSSSAAYPVCYQRQGGCEYGYHWEGSHHPNIKLREDLIYLDDPESPDANYGWAKLTGERLAKDYASQGGRVHVVRPFSGYGEGQSLDYPFPSIIERASKGDLTVWGPVGQTRDWIHVSDIVNGALEVYAQNVREPINLCTGVGTEMGDLMRMVLMQWTDDFGREHLPKIENLIDYLEDKPTGVFYRVGDPTKMRQIYEPKITIEEGVRTYGEQRG